MTDSQFESGSQQEQEALRCLSEGLASLTSPDFVQVSRNLARSFALFPGLFSTDRDAVLRYRQAADRAKESGLSHNYLAAHRAQLTQNKISSEFYYELFLRRLFEERLVHELFCEFTKIEEEESRWRESLVTRGEHPYAHYRLGILHCFKGELGEGANKFLYCQDKLPSSKWENLRLGSLSDFTRDLFRLQATATGRASAQHSEEEWAKSGFSDPFQVRAWSSAGFSPTEASEWKEFGFTPPQALSWSKVGMGGEHARDWQKFGFIDPVDARSWHFAGVSAEEAQEWKIDFLEPYSHPISAAIQCRNVGLRPARVAADWLRVFTLPWEAANWHAVGFSPAEALLWRERGVKDPFVAKREIELKQTQDLGEQGDFEIENDEDFEDEVG